MLELMRHRGPDDRDAKVLQNLALGHLRLSILDLSPRGRQPLTIEGSRYWISFNGEVYNYLELRRELTALGAEFTTETDTEVILQAYRHWGEDCFQRFNGMWALAIWDQQTRRLVLSRDRVGIKPLYLSLDQGQLVFASEIKAILAFRQKAGLPIELESKAVQIYLSSGQVDGLEPTFFQKIFRFKSGHLMVVQDGAVKAYRPYWDLPALALARRAELEGLDQEETAARLCDLVQDAVAIHTRSDVPVGVCLSGGLDSSCVAGMASQSIPRLRTFTTWCEEGEEFDESAYARQVNNLFKLEPNMVKVPGEELLDTIGEMLWFLDEPTLAYGIYSMWHVMKAASGQVTVVMDGQGGDELFAGYDFYAPQFLYSQVLQGRREVFQQTLDGYRRNYGPQRAAELQAQAADLRQRRFEDGVPKIFPGHLDNHLFLELSQTRLPALLRNEDRLSMAFSLESRVPLLDYRLIEFAFALKEELKIGPGWSKYIFRLAMRGLLPAEITWRKDKKGFPTPFEIWADGLHRGAIRELLQGPSARLNAYLARPEVDGFFQAWDQGQKNPWMAWRLLCLEVWLGGYLQRLARQVQAFDQAAVSGIASSSPAQGRLRLARAGEKAEPPVSDTHHAEAEISALWQRAQGLLSAGQIRDADAALVGLLDRQPGHREAMVSLGTLRVREQDAAGAVQVFQDMLGAYPQDALAHNLMGVAQLAGGHAGQAALCFAQAASLEPGNYMFTANAAKAHLMAGHWPQARAFLDNALTLAPPAGEAELRDLLAQCPESEPQPYGAVRVESAEERRHALFARGEQETPEARMPESWMDDRLAGLLAPPEGLDERLREDAQVLRGVRILHAPSEIAGNLERISRNQRAVGVDATSVNYGFNTWANYKCDINLNLPSLSPQEGQRVLKEFVTKAVDDYDIFHFHYARSLMTNLSDLDLLREKGKKIVFSFWGSDHRSDECIYYQQARFLGLDPPAPYFLNRQYNHLHKIINHYADVMIGAACLPRGLWVPGYMDTSQWNPQEKLDLREGQPRKDPDKLYVLHAASDPRYKGSLVIKRLLEVCREQGLAIEPLFVSGVEPAKAKAMYAMADCAIDNIAGSFGGFGAEMMLWEIPVLVYHCQSFRRLRGEPPLIHITKRNFIDQIRRCLEMKRSGELAELGREARAWTCANVEIKSRGVPVYLRIYRTLWEGGQVPQYVNLDWHRQDAAMARGVKLDFYAYLREHGFFEEMGMPLPQIDTSLYS
jgi:asparagine synthase (glutamine-hydrolysing)